MSRLILLFGIWLSLMGCTTIPTLYTSLPSPPIIPSLSSQMKEDEVRQHLHEAMKYRNQIEGWIELNQHQYLHEEYTTALDRNQYCRLDQYVTLIPLPKLPEIKDDGRHSDDVIIRQLVQHLKQLRRIIKEYNTQLGNKIQEYHSKCL